MSWLPFHLGLSFATMPGHDHTLRAMFRLDSLSNLTMVLNWVCPVCRLELGHFWRAQLVSFCTLFFSLIDFCWWTYFSSVHRVVGSVNTSNVTPHWESGSMFTPLLYLQVVSIPLWWYSGTRYWTGLPAMQLCRPPFRGRRLVRLNWLPLSVTLESAFRIFSRRLLVRFYIYALVITSFLFSSFLVWGCAPQWIILETLLLYFWCEDRLAGTTFISLKCGSARFVKTLSMVANHCPRLGQF